MAPHLGASDARRDDGHPGAAGPQPSRPVAGLATHPGEPERLVDVVQHQQPRLLRRVQTAPDEIGRADVPGPRVLDRLLGRAQLPGHLAHAGEKAVLRRRRDPEDPVALVVGPPGEAQRDGGLAAAAQTVQDLRAAVRRRQLVHQEAEQLRPAPDHRQLAERRPDRGDGEACGGRGPGSVRVAGP